MPDIVLQGATYSDVPAVDLPKSPSGTARFYDITGVTATANDVIAGKYFIDANGVLTVGTLSLAPDVLYNDSTGTGIQNNITLSASAANYDHMRIYWRTNDGNTFVSSITIINPDGKAPELITAHVGNGTDMYIKSKVLQISGTSITRVSQMYGEADVKTGSTTFTATDCFYITRVEAWNDSTNFANIYSSSSAPTSTQGIDGDVWLVTE